MNIENMSKDQNLTEVFYEILNTYALLYAEPVSSDHLIWSDDNYILVTMNFNGSTSGYMGIAAPDKLCTIITEHILGNDCPGDKCDSFKELINIMCAEYVVREFGTKEKFDFTIPKLRKIDESDWNSLKHEIKMGFAAGGVPIIPFVKIRSKEIK